MKLPRRQFVFSAPFALVASDAALGAPQASARLRGRIACLTEELARRHQVAPDCDARGHVYALKTAEGKYHPLLPTDGAAAVWLDERYRQLDLQIVARRFAETDFIEVIKYQTWRGAKLFDLEYHCLVCNISVHKPMPCECCQDPVEYREVLVREN